MKIKLYKYDEFPITYDTETKEKICIGFCMQCPLYCDNHQLIEEKILDCDEIISQMIKENIYS